MRDAVRIGAVREAQHADWTGIPLACSAATAAYMDGPIPLVAITAEQE